MRVYPKFKRAPNAQTDCAFITRAPKGKTKSAEVRFLAFPQTRTKSAKAHSMSWRHTHPKRRQSTGKNAPRLVGFNSSEVRAMFAKKDQPFNVALVGSALILAKVLSRDLLETPEPLGRPLRLAFGIWDRIRTGEMPTWSCALCAAKRSGLSTLSCFGIIDQLGSAGSYPAVIMPICQVCDSISTEETHRRVTAMFPLCLAGRA